MGDPRWRRLAGLILLGVLAVLLWRAWDDPLDESESRAPSASTAPSASPQTAEPTPSRASTTSQGSSGLPLVAATDLPVEAQQTLQAIDAGGPFAYRQDGGTFQNREGHLPSEPNGFYKEYTVETPGSDDRGARRIVVGNDGVFYYTDDHYDSFREVTR